MISILHAAALPAIIAFSAPGIHGGTDTTAVDVPTYSVDEAHSSIGFKVRHLGITNVNGRFADFDATFRVDPEDLSTLEATATIQVGSIDTGAEKRDGHLKSDDFFDAASHPAITFVSKGVRNVDGDEFELVGDLTIRGTTREVVLDGTFLGEATMGDSRRVAIEASTEINRFDYGLKWNAVTEIGGLIVSEKVKILLEIQAVQN
jgi:polyisoprenoid-binding protein YceI